MSDKTIISMAFPTKLLKEIDKQAKAEYTTRSDYIRRAVVRTTKRQKQDEIDAAWDKLLELSDELAAAAKKAGYVTDEDWARLDKEIKADRKNWSL